MSANSSELQELINLAKEDIVKTKADVEAAQKANDKAAATALVAGKARDDQSAKIEQLKVQAIQARVDGKIELADKLDAQIDVEMKTYQQLSDLAQEKHNTAQYAVDDLMWAQEFHDKAQINLRTLEDQRRSSTPTATAPSNNTNVNNSTTSTSSTSKNIGISVGDKVQIRAGAIDVTNGVVSQSGGLYVEGTSLWATVESIDYEWSTGGRWGLPSKVVKVRCKGADGQTIVWQVTPDDIASNVMKANVEIQTIATPKAPTVELTDAGKTDLNVVDVTIARDKDVQSNNPYTTKVKGQSWAQGIATKSATTGTLPSTCAVKTGTSSGTYMGNISSVKY